MLIRSNCLQLSLIFESELPEVGKSLTNTSTRRIDILSKYTSSSRLEMSLKGGSSPAKEENAPQPSRGESTKGKSEDDKFVKASSTDPDATPRLTDHPNLRRLAQESEHDFWNRRGLGSDRRPFSDLIRDGDEVKSISGIESHDGSDEAEASGDSQNQSGSSDPVHEDSPETNKRSFVGPFGKKRMHCKERHASGDPDNHDSSSNLSSNLLDDKDCSTDSVNFQRRFALEPHSETLVIEPPASSPITSTPFSVIKSPRRVEEPLNLSQAPHLIIDDQSEPQTVSVIESTTSHTLPLLRKRKSVPVSVISIAPRVERECFKDVHQPISIDSSSSNNSPSSHSIHSTDLPGLLMEIERQATETGLPSLIGNNYYQSQRMDSPIPSTSRGLQSNSIDNASIQHQLPLHLHLPTQELASQHQGPLSSESKGGGAPGEKKKLQCQDCGKEFSQLRNYRYHRSRHEGTQQFACTCPICGKSFNDKGYLSSHLKIHRNAKEYKCEWCEKSFNQRVAYNMHVRIHTGHKPHQCPVCPKAFSRKMLLRQHLRTHTGERPYKCSFCQKAFADRSNMLLHQRLHSGERPYACDICGKTFSKNHHLKTHLNHHAGIKPYQCEKCKATFSQSSNMKTHFRKCSGIPSTSTITSCSDVTFSAASSIMSVAGPSSARSQNQARQRSATITSGMTIQQQRQFLSNRSPSTLSSQQQQQLLMDAGEVASAAASALLSMDPVSQAAAVQSLGLNFGVMGLSPPGNRGRMRRSTGGGSVSFTSMGSPSPTSLAAGHFIPLASMEQVGPRTSPPLTTHGLMLLSPHSQHSSRSSSTSIDNSSYPRHQIFQQGATIQQQVNVSSRARLVQQQQQQQTDYQPQLTLFHVNECASVCHCARCIECMHE